MSATGGYVQLRAAGALFKNVPIHDAGMTRRRKPQHDLAEGNEVERLFFHRKALHTVIFNFSIA